MKARIRVAIVVGAGLVAACGGGAGQGPAVQGPAATSSSGVTPAAPSVPVSSSPDVTLLDAKSATVRGAPIAFDGIEEGLAWPALDKALPPRKAGDVLTLQVARTVPTIALLRAAWTLRQADLHVQSLDGAGVMRAVGFTARREGPPTSGCHLAVFLAPDGSLRVASPGGPVTFRGDDATSSFSRALAAQGAKCPIRYVAFGAESDGAPWGPVFDVIAAVEAAKAAGDARYVLGQAMHTTP